MPTTVRLHQFFSAHYGRAIPILNSLSVYLFSRVYSEKLLLSSIGFLFSRAYSEKMLLSLLNLIVILLIYIVAKVNE